jgi:hypothetical protein
MSYQCLVAKNIAKNIRNKQLGLVCSDFCDYYDLILFDFIETTIVDCSDTDYDEDYTYPISDHQLPTSTQTELANSGSTSSTSDCSGSDYEIIEDQSDEELQECSNNILIEFIDQNGVVTNNPGNIDDMRPTYYDFTFIGTYELTLPVRTLVHVIVFTPTASSTISVGTESGDDDVVYEVSITTSPSNSPFTLNQYYNAGVVLYFASTTTINVRVYVE